MNPDELKAELSEAVPPTYCLENYPHGKIERRLISCDRESGVAHLEVRWIPAARLPVINQKIVFNPYEDFGGDEFDPLKEKEESK